MRSDTEFDMFISDWLKQSADNAEVPVRCKAEIDERIECSESNRKKGGIKQMKKWTVKKIVTTAAVCCLLIGTGVYAAGKLTYIESHSSSEPSITEYEKTSQTGLYLPAEE